MAILLMILKLIGKLLLAVIVLALLLVVLVLFVPVRYVAECRSKGTFRVGFRLSWLRVIQMKKSISESRIHIYLFGINIRNWKNLFRREKREEEDHHVTESRVKLVDDFYEEAVRHEEAVKKEEERYRADVETDYEEEKEEENTEEDKKIFSFDTIFSIIGFVRDSENKSAIRKMKKELVDLVSYLLPKRLEGKILFGTGDPCTTGWLLGAISMFPIAYTEGVTITPDFEEKVFSADGVAGGRARVIYFLRLLVRGYMDDDIKKCITQILK